MSSIESLRKDLNRFNAPNRSSQDYLKNFVKFPENEGTLVVRLLPPKDGDDFYCVTRLHSINNKRSIHCLRYPDSKGRWVGNCPICEWYAYLWKEFERLSKSDPHAAEDMRSRARAIKPVERYYWNAIDRSCEEDGPKILSIGVTLHEKIIRSVFGDEDMKEEGYGDVTDIHDGRDFKIMKRLKKGTDFPSYDESRFLDPSPLGGKDKINLWLDLLHNLAALRKDRLKDVETLTRECKIENGTIPDPSVSFDVKEILSPEDTGSAQEIPVAHTVQTKEEVKSVVPELDEDRDISLADGDFLKDLEKQLDG